MLKLVDDGCIISNPGVIQRFPNTAAATNFPIIGSELLVLCIVALHLSDCMHRM